MSRNLHPSEGARFVLERTSADDGATATYKVSIYTPDTVDASTATLTDDGTATLAAPTGAPSELDERLVNLAKLVARDAPKRREDGLVVWPARIMRWRK